MDLPKRFKQDSWDKKKIKQKRTMNKCWKLTNGRIMNSLLLFSTSGMALPLFASFLPPHKSNSISTGRTNTTWTSLPSNLKIVVLVWLEVQTLLLPLYYYRCLRTFPQHYRFHPSSMGNSRIKQFTVGPQCNFHCLIPVIL